MKIFEYFLNPQIKEDTILKSFFWEPKNIYEKKLGSLYLVFELKNALPKDIGFLTQIGKIFQKNFYRKFSESQKKAFKDSLKEVNEFLNETLKKNEVNWLGNLSAFALNFKDGNLNFSKLGKIKIFLKRGKKIIDVEKKAKICDVETLIFKGFGNIISGNLIEGDLLFVLSEKIVEGIFEENLMDKLKQIIIFEEKKIEEIFKEKKEKFQNKKGFLIAFVLAKEQKKEIIIPDFKEEFSLSKFLTSLFRPLLEKEKEKEEFSFKKIFFPYKRKLVSFLSDKRVLLILFFLLVLLLGYILF